MTEMPEIPGDEIGYVDRNGGNFVLLKQSCRYVLDTAYSCKTTHSKAEKGTQPENRAVGPVQTQTQICGLGPWVPFFTGL